jgi:chromosomal replication initiation ATPase DnaA
MYYTTISPAATSRQIARPVEQMVKERSGMSINVLQYPTELVNNTPQRMLHVIALALDMNPECYRWKTRVRSIVEMRFIATLFLRQHFPALTLHQIAGYFGGQDHSSVINGLSRAHNLIYVQDSAFLKKYNTTLKSVNTWLRRGVSDCVSVTSV